MKKTILMLFMGLVGLQASNVNAETLFRPRASIGFANYELSSPNSATELSSSSYATAGAGATLAIDSVYFDVATTTSLSATYDANGQDEDFSRTDAAFTVGYILGGGVSIFGGFKTGGTEYTNLTANATKTTFDTDGVFFGASASFPVGSSVISVNGAIALLDGTLEDNDTNPTVQFDESADTVGVSLGAAYTMNFGGSGLTLKTAFQNYSFTNWTGNFSDNVAQIEDLDESVFSADVTYFINF